MKQIFCQNQEIRLKKRNTPVANKNLIYIIYSELRSFYHLVQSISIFEKWFHSRLLIRQNTISIRKKYFWTLIQRLPNFGVGLYEKCKTQFKNHQAKGFRMPQNQDLKNFRTLIYLNGQVNLWDFRRKFKKFSLSPPLSKCILLTLTKIGFEILVARNGLV